MKNKIFYNFIALLLIVWSCFLYFKGHLPRILHPDKYYLACTDFGQYFIEVEDYLRESTNYRDLLKVGEEPGFFIIATNLWRVANIPSQNLLTLFAMFVYCLVGLCLLILCRQKSLQNQRGEHITWIICLIIYISLYGTVESFVSGIWRQTMWTFFFLVFLISRNYPSSKWYTIVGIFSWAMLIFTHRIFTIIGGSIFIFILLRSFFQGKKEIKKNLYFLIAIIFLCLPYITLFYGYIIEFFNYKQKIILEWDQTRWDFTLYQSAKYLWWSFFGQNDGRTAIVHYLFYQSYIVIACIGFFSNTFQKFTKVYVFTLLFLFAYVLDRFDFSVRVLLIFEIIMLPIIAVNMSINYTKYVKILLVVGIFLLWFLTLSKSLLRRPPAAREFDDGINFLINTVNKKEKHFFLGSACSWDLLSQLSFTSYFNIHMSLYNMVEKKKKLEPDLADAGVYTNLNLIFLKREGIMFDFFKDKWALYIIFTEKDRAEVALVKSGQSNLQTKEYLTLIYPQTYLLPWAWIIKYIFKINTDLIKYTDTRTYIMENIMNFGLN